jgi:hypothetical protein
MERKIEYLVSNENFGIYDGIYKNTSIFKSKKVKDKGLPYVVTLKNTSEEKKEAAIFGFNKHSLKPNFGNDEYVQISSKHCDYDMLLCESLKGFYFEEIYIQSHNAEQVFLPFNFHAYEANGRKVSMPTFPRLDPEQNIKNIAFLKCGFNISSETFFKIQILPKTEVIFTFYEPTLMIVPSIARRKILKIKNSIKNIYNKIIKTKIK